MSEYLYRSQVIDWLVAEHGFTRGQVMGLLRKGVLPGRTPAELWDVPATGVPPEAWGRWKRYRRSEVRAILKLQDGNTQGGLHAHS